MENRQHLDTEMLGMLRCPANHTSLSIAPAEVVAKINQQIANGRLTNANGDKLEKQLDGGLIREAGDLLYPIIDRIPVMLSVEAIDLAQIGEGT